MFTRIRVIGRGRLGSALVARLAARGHQVVDDDVQVVVLCVPDGAIATVAASIEPGPWVCHMSGATPLSACAPHVRRFGVHPLQTFRRGDGPSQFDGAWGAVSGETADARSAAEWFGAELGLRTFAIDEDRRALYHMGATMASSYLVTLYRMASRACEMAGAPPEALVPLMRRTIDNDFDLTGPFARGDWGTVEMHLRAIRTFAPDLEPSYQALADATVRNIKPGSAQP
jgi:predicted short-subunit dehydrogenase-like oxidoreductase (DUF2520 family)